MTGEMWLVLNNFSITLRSSSVIESTVKLVISTKVKTLYVLTLALNGLNADYVNQLNDKLHNILL